MKQTTMILFFFLSACIGKVEKTPVPAPPKILAVHLNDFSKSTNTITFYDTLTAKDLYYHIAEKGGGVIKFLGVYENSNIQDILTFTAQLDTVSEQTENVYQKTKIKSKNERIRAEFEIRSKADIAQYINAVSQPHNSPYTDLQNALALAKQTTEQENFTGYTKYLILSSDMLNDPKGQPKDLQPVQLSNTTVLAIRPALSLEKLQQVFPQSSVYVFTTPQDIISFIKNKNQ